MKVVKNNKYGGFSLSAKATKRIAELEGKECYFFKINYSAPERYIPVKMEDIEKRDLFWTAYSVPDPSEYRLSERDADGTFQSANKRAEKINLDSRPHDRSNPLLVKVVEELGEEANGAYASLEVVEIPDGVEYEIDEYDGIETIREKHRSW